MVRRNLEFINIDFDIYRYYEGSLVEKLPYTNEIAE